MQAVCPQTSGTAIWARGVRAVSIHRTHDTGAGVVCHQCQERSGETLERPCAAQGDTARALNRIGNTARQMAGAIVTEGGSAQFAERHAAAIEADVALLRQVV